MHRQNIILVVFGPFEQEVLNQISVTIAKTFQLRVRIVEYNSDLSEYYNPERRQYDANRILQVVCDIAPADALKTIGLLKVDLFIPILTFIFGQAKLDGRSGIVSMFRLRNELYGLKQNQLLQLNRLKKVSIHELGHTFGLIHCSNPVCVMRSSTYVEDLDQKEVHFCRSCREKMEKKKEAMIASFNH